MADRGLINDTPFAVQELYLSDEHGRDLLAVVIKATYAVTSEHRLVLLEEQPPIDVAGTYEGEPGVSSLRFEPEVAPYKCATDVVLVGHAYAQRHGTTELDVGFQVGPVRKVLRVFGDRHWEGRLGLRVISAAQPFTRMPLVYERAFGGWDRTAADPDKHTVAARNPVGVGYHAWRHGVFVEGEPLPNLEDPRHLVRNYTDTPPPAGFGFIGAGWMPRRQYAGTYDEAWEKTRSPLLPEDFDRRFYNAAPLDQVAPGYLRGDEPVVIVNAVPEGRLSFSLPGQPPPPCTITMQDRAVHTPPARLDTVILDPDNGQVRLIWRAHMLVEGGPHRVRAIQVQPPADRSRLDNTRPAVFDKEKTKEKSWALQ